MSWLKNHKESERLASAAEIAIKKGDVAQAKKLYRLAAEAEVQALSAIDPKKTRTFGITVVSAMALYYKAGDYNEVRLLAEKWGGNNDLPRFAVNQMHELLGDTEGSALQDESIKDESNKMESASVSSSSEDTVLASGKRNHSETDSFTNSNNSIVLLQGLRKWNNRSLRYLSIFVILLVPSLISLLAYHLYVQGKYNHLKEEQEQVLEDSRIEILRLKTSIQILTTWTLKDKDRELALRLVDDIFAAKTIEEIAPHLESGDILGAISLVASSGNPKAKDAASGILAIIATQTGGDQENAAETLNTLNRSAYPYSGSEAIRIKVVSRNQPQHLTATLNGQNLQLNDDNISFKLNEGDQISFLKITFQGNLGETYKIRIEGQEDGVKIIEMIEQKQAETSRVIIFKAG